MKSFMVATIGLALSLTVQAHGDGHEQVMQQVKSKSKYQVTWKDMLKKAMNSEIRSEQEVKRDANRMPLETLEFFGLKGDMKVLELIPGGGWYTKLLAPTLAYKGKYYAALGTGRVKERLLDKPGFGKVNLIKVDAAFSRDEETRLNSIGEFTFDVEPLDMVLTFRNYHNFNEEGRKNINKAAFAALKSGGIYGVIDHTRRHMTPLNDETRRRIDPVLAIKEIQEAGFVLVDFSELHYRPQDGLVKEVGHESVTGQTDRWTLKFKKP